MKKNYISNHIQSVSVILHSTSLLFCEYFYVLMAGLINIGCCLTDFLLESSFKNFSFERKKTIIEIGRARPEMTIDYKRNDGFTKHFHQNLYDKYSWLTGSCKKNKMFCFPCLLFSDSNSVWSRTGYSDINNLVNSAKKHVQTEKHLRSSVSLHEFGNSRIETFFSNSFEAHNRKVDTNRSLMKRFIDTVVLLAKQELPFRGHDESLNSVNRGNYIETLSYLSQYDSVLSNHLDHSASSSHSVFTGLSSDIQNDLIQCIASVVRDEIRIEIGKARFVSAMIDETPDVCHREQLTIVLRYVSDKGIEERFLGFFDVSGSRNADVLSKMLIDSLKEYNCLNKLIGQSYDGAAVMSGEHGGVQAKIRSVCPMAVFIPCYAHVLNLVLSRSLENIPELKAFFGHVNSIVRFFNKSSKRSNLLKQIADRRLPGVSETRWHYHSRIINVLFNCRIDMVSTFERIIQNLESWDSESVSLSETFLSKFSDMQFCFLLHAFSEIFAQTDILFSLLQNKQVDLEKANNGIKSFETWISQTFINHFDSIYSSIEEYCEPPRRRQRLNNPEIDLKTSFKRLFVEIIDHVKSQISNRYQCFSTLPFLDLINTSKFVSYSERFPDEQLSSLQTNFPQIFDITALRNELKVFYTTPSLNLLNISELNSKLRSSDLGQTFPQMLTLSNLFCTLPITVASAERSFSALKRIQTYVRNTQSQHRLSDLAELSIEKRFLLSIKNNSNFYDKVLGHFLKKNRRIALEYK